MAKSRMPMGMGGANMNNMIKQAQKMQQNMLKMQEEMEQTEFEATSGGAVTVKMSGKKELTSISIKPEAVDPDDVEMLEDLILAAVNEVIKNVDTASANKMSSITGGLNIPGMF